MTISGSLFTFYRTSLYSRSSLWARCSLPFNTDFEKKKKETYLLVVGYFRSEDYLKSVTLVDTCLEKGFAYDRFESLKDGMESVDVESILVEAVVGGPNATFVLEY
ncbi:hypothetical protein Tco_0145022 [Tanacetum coccineum]